MLLKFFLDESNREPNKIWVDEGSEFYNRSMRSFWQNNELKIYSTHNEGESVISGRFVRTLKNNVYKYTTSVSNNVYIDKLDDIVNKDDYISLLELFMRKNCKKQIKENLELKK